LTGSGTLHVQDFHWLNSANIAFLSKKDGAEEISDFRPISFIHGIDKIIAKMLALRLAPFMDVLVSKAQSAFIKKRSIQITFSTSRTLPRGSAKGRSRPISSNLIFSRPLISLVGSTFLTFCKDVSSP
jgi:hypothetical protein